MLKSRKQYSISERMRNIYYSVYFEDYEQIIKYFQWRNPDIDMSDTFNREMLKGYGEQFIGKRPPRKHRDLTNPLNLGFNHTLRQEVYKQPLRAE